MEHDESASSVAVVFNQQQVIHISCGPCEMAISEPPKDLPTCSAHWAGVTQVNKATIIHDSCTMVLWLIAWLLSKPLTLKGQDLLNVLRF